MCVFVVGFSVRVRCGCGWFDKESSCDMIRVWCLGVESFVCSGGAMENSLFRFERIEGKKSKFVLMI